MPFLIRRITSALLAVVVIGSMAVEDAFAQAPTVGPAGGVASTTAPANGEGTPAGGTGTLGTTRVGPSGVTQSAASPATPPGPPPVVQARRRRRLRRPVAARRPTSPEVGTQSQQGTNGAAVPATR